MTDAVPAPQGATLSFDERALLQALAALFVQQDDGALTYGFMTDTDVLTLLEPAQAAALVAFRVQHNIDNRNFT